ncbi:MAG TPA: hypothetical protein VH393_02660 [Ktedonobacterales bacterium]
MREEPLYSDALAVARETMRRMRWNIETLIPRLRDIGYEFGYGWIQPPSHVVYDWDQRQRYAKKIQWAREQPVIFTTATETEEEIVAQTARLARLRSRGAPKIILDHWEIKIAELHAQPTAARLVADFEVAHGLLPISARAWYEIVGSVNFVGFHPGWSEYLQVDAAYRREYELDEDDNGGHWFSDVEPIFIYPLARAQSLKNAEYSLSESLFPLMPTRDATYGEVGQGAFEYMIEVPCAAADSLLHYEEHETTFVNYLRICFRWGGFPGWERIEARPDEDLAYLTEGLQSI